MRFSRPVTFSRIVWKIFRRYWAYFNHFFLHFLDFPPDTSPSLIIADKYDQKSIQIVINKLILIHAIHGKNLYKKSMYCIYGKRKIIFAKTKGITVFFQVVCLYSNPNISSDNSGD